MSTLSCKNLSVTLSNRPIVRDVSFDIASGDCIGLIGPNGSGKTTLFNALSGFVPSTGGSVMLNNTELSKMPAHKRSRAGLGRVFQASGVFRELTILENMQVAFENSALCVSGSKTSARAKITESLAEVGLAGRERELAGSLSGGQLRLLEIARACIAGAKVILLDEPTAGVSPKMRGELQTIIKRTQANGTTIFVIEHDMNFISELCSRVLVMHEGELIIQGTPSEVRSNAQLAQIYFGG